MSNWINWRIAIIRDKSLTFGAKGMALYLNTYMNDRQDAAWPAIATVCDEMSITNKTAIKYLSELTDSGWLSKQKRFGNSTRYRVLIPSSVKSALVEEIHSSSGEYTPTVMEDLHTNKQLNKQTNKQEGDCAPALPENLDQQAWSDWDDYRKSSAKLRKGWSDAGKKKSIELLVQYPAEDQRRAVNYSIRGGYTGLFEDQLTKGQPRNGTPAAPAALAASHKPFTEPPKQTQADKAKAKADLDRMQAQIAARQGPAHKRKQIAACRFPANLSKLCRHYGWGDPPAGLEFTDAKTWAIKQAERDA